MKFFVFSDCHGYFNELKSALDEAGFDPNNESHWLVGCGDYFDRGRQPQEIVEYLMSIKNKTLVKGNHESLLQEIYGRVLAYNITSLIARSITLEKNKKINFSTAINFCRQYLKSRISKIVLYKLLYRHKSPIRENRNFPRFKNQKHSVSFSYRI